MLKTHSKHVKDTLKRLYNKISNDSIPRRVLNRQEDAGETLSTLLQQILTELKPPPKGKRSKKNKNILPEPKCPFQQEYCSVTFCTICNIVYQTKDKQSILHIPVSRDLSTVQSLKSSLLKWHEESNLQPGWNGCKEHDSVYHFKKLCITKAPVNLIIELGRLSNNANKINNPVSFPLKNLDLSLISDGTETNLLYNLFAVTCHNGTNAHNGHYVAFVRHPHSTNWFKYSDMIVTDSSENEVRNQLQTAVLLFYERKNSSLPSSCSVSESRATVSTHIAIQSTESCKKKKRNRDANIEDTNQWEIGDINMR